MKLTLNVTITHTHTHWQNHTLTLFLQELCTAVQKRMSRVVLLLKTTFSCCSKTERAPQQSCDPTNNDIIHSILSNQCRPKLHLCLPMISCQYGKDLLWDDNHHYMGSRGSPPWVGFTLCASWMFAGGGPSVGNLKLKINCIINPPIFSHNVRLNFQKLAPPSIYWRRQ